MIKMADTEDSTEDFHEMLEVSREDEMTAEEQLLGNKKSEKREHLESWLNKLMRIKISDGRTLIGSFLCTDKDMNVILGSCQEYVGEPGVGKEEPRILGLAMIPGRHIKSIEIDMHKPPKYGGEFV